MNTSKALYYIRTFFVAFLVYAILDFLTDKYLLNRFEPYRMLFMATWMAVFITFQAYRRRKKAELKKAKIF